MLLNMGQIGKDGFWAPLTGCDIYAMIYNQYHFAWLIKRYRGESGGQNLSILALDHNYLYIFLLTKSPPLVGNTWKRRYSFKNFQVSR